MWLGCPKARIRLQQAGIRLYAVSRGWFDTALELGRMKA